MLKIGEFARVAGVSAKLLRAWDELGLFRPVWVDPENGYRYYSPAQLPELRRILALRDVGVPLAELSELVDGGADLREVLARRRDNLEEERREIERRLRALDITVATSDGPPRRAGSLVGQRTGWDVVIRPVAAEAVALLEVDLRESDLGPVFHDLESYVRDQRRRAAGPAGAIDNSTPDDPRVQVFVPVSGPIPSRAGISYQRLPACRAASLIHRGSYDGLVAARQALARWVGSAEMAPVAPMRVLYLHFGAEPELKVPPGYVVDRRADFVTELQLPVG